MRIQFLYFELLLALEIILRAVLSIDWHISLLIYGLTIILKALFEGYRLHWPLFIIAACISIPPVRALQFIAIPIILFAVLYFPVYHNIKPSGPYRVGYRELWLNNASLHVSVFYPTTERGKDVLQFTGRIPPWKNFYESSRLVAGGGLPEWYCKIALSYLSHRKIGVNANTRIIPEFSSTHKAFPVIVFSHGLGSGKDSYSFYRKEWASRGYIVLSVDHSDVIYPPSGITDDFAHRNVDLRKRFADMRVVLDYVMNQDALRNLLQENIEIDYMRVSAVGHSYGGCTAAYLSLMDKRVTGACVCMDPWYFPLEEQVYKAMDKPLLIITTSMFQKQAKGNLERVIRLANLNKNFSEQTIVCSFEGAAHNNLADNGLFMAREMVLLKGLGPFHLIEKVFWNHASLIEAFLEVTVLERGRRSDVRKENVIDRYREKKYYSEVKLIYEDLKEKRMGLVECIIL